MPREKVLLMVEVMRLDLMHYRSSRRKKRAAKSPVVNRPADHEPLKHKRTDE
jgi:hypothetical protein